MPIASITLCVDGIAFSTKIALFKIGLIALFSKGTTISPSLLITPIFEATTKGSIASTKAVEATKFPLLNFSPSKK